MADITAAAPDPPTQDGEPLVQDDDLGRADELPLDDELLVEDVSIDGMCGVY